MTARASHSVLSDPALGALWDAVAARLQRNGLSPIGHVVLGDLEKEERFALAGLLGRPLTSERVRIDLAGLDRRLRETGIAAGLVAAANSCRGPLTDRRGERAERVARRDALWSSWRSQLAEVGLDRAEWCERWAESLRPLLGGDPVSSVAALLAAATHCVARLCSDSGAALGRTELAAEYFGDSHGLDDGSLANAIVLRALAACYRAPTPKTAGARRLLWQQAGVLCDEVSTTVLCYGLVPPSAGSPAGSGIDVEGRPAHASSADQADRPPVDGSSVSGRLLASRSMAGWETHLTLRDLRRLERVVDDGTEVFVCENPRVLEAAMEASSKAAIVCTSGNPTLVVTRLLERLVSDGARLRYHGDFDWPGVAIANRVVERFGAGPWRMAKEDYEAALVAAGPAVAELPRLDGSPVRAVWAPDLTSAMQRAGRAVHEEAVLGQLVGDLT